MKTNIKAALTVAMAALVLSACNDSADVRNIKGGYHFKTSGQVTVSQPKTDSYTYTLTNETGTMEVVSLHDDDNLLLTFNQTNGGVYSTTGTTDGEKLEFEPFERTLTIRTETTRYDTLSIGIGIFTKDTVITTTLPGSETFNVTVDGEAKVYDNNLIFTFKYEGESQSTDKTIKGESIQMIAKKN